MLPPGFEWIPRYSYAPPGEVALVVDGLWVAQLLKRLDGEWLVELSFGGDMDAPRKTRRCSSHAAGMAGAEAWALRHEVRLRALAAARVKPRPTWLPKEFPESEGTGKDPGGGLPGE